MKKNFVIVVAVLAALIFIPVFALPLALLFGLIVWGALERPASAESTFSSEPEAREVSFLEELAESFAEICVELSIEGALEILREEEALRASEEEIFWAESYLDYCDAREEILPVIVLKKSERKVRSFAAKKECTKKIALKKIVEESAKEEIVVEENALELEELFLLACKGLVEELVIEEEEEEIEEPAAEEEEFEELVIEEEEEEIEEPAAEEEAVEKSFGSFEDLLCEIKKESAAPAREHTTPARSANRCYQIQGRLEALGTKLCGRTWTQKLMEEQFGKKWKKEHPELQAALKKMKETGKECQSGSFLLMYEPEKADELIARAEADYENLANMYRALRDANN